MLKGGDHHEGQLHYEFQTKIRSIVPRSIAFSLPVAIFQFKCAELKLIACWDLKEHHIIIIIIKNHKEKISIEFPESSNLENRTSHKEIFTHLTYDVIVMILQRGKNRASTKASKGYINQKVFMTVSKM